MSHVLGAGLLSAGFLCAGFVTHPSAAFASASAQAPVTPAQSHSVTLDANGTSTQEVSAAATVADFLREHNIVDGPHDYLDPSADVPLSDGLVVEYRAAVSVTVQTARERVRIVSAADDVGALLEEQNIRLNADDRVTPGLAEAVPANGTIRIVRVLTWEKNEPRVVEPQIVHRVDHTLAPGSSRVIAKGGAGLREDFVKFTQFDGGDIQRSVIRSRVLRKMRPRIVADGVDEFDAFSFMERRGVLQTEYMTEHAMEMVATAYTAGCAGCSGMTAIGKPAGHGIVAVDPSVIPLGTRLFIPGYGLAIAGDTGGAIHGYRIDLGFNSARDAMLFGRRSITVYRLK